MTEAALPATRVRYLIVGTATLMSFLLYLDRFCVSFAADYIRQDLGLTQSDMSWFLGGFFLTYSLAQVPSGWLSDRYGARSVLVLYILGWSLFTGLIGTATGFVSLIIWRLGCGLWQAGAYPTAASVVGRWMPVSARGTASSVVANGGRIGGALAPVLTAFLIIQFVPLETPVELSSADILMPAKLAGRLVAPEPAKVASATVQASSTAAAAPPRPAAWIESRIRTRSESDLEKLRTSLDSQPEKSLDQTSLDSSGQALTDGNRSVPAEPSRTGQPEVDPALIVSLLNPLLSDTELYDAKSMSGLSLPSEALKTLAQLDARQDVSTAELQRFNRLLLESVFGQEIRKLYGLGWRPILFIYGAAGLFVALFLWVMFRNSPQQHPWINQAELTLIQGEGAARPPSGRSIGPAPLKTLILSANMWYCSIMQMGTNIGWLFIMTWLPRYLLDVHNVPILERGTMTMVPVLVGMVGMFMGGRLTDVLAGHLGLRWGRRAPILGSRLTGILAYLGCIGLSLLPAGHPLNSPWAYTALFGLVAFSTDFGAAPTWAFCQDVGGRHVGSVLGWGNMWGNLGAFVAPPLIYDQILGETPSLENWNTMFGVCALAFAVSGVCALMIDASRPVIASEDGPAQAAL